MAKKYDLESLLAGDGDDEQTPDDVVHRREELLEEWAEHPWNLLTAVDPTTLDRKGEPVPVYWTKDEADPRGQPKPFPSWVETFEWQRKSLGSHVYLDYLEEFVNVLHLELLRSYREQECSVVLLDKSRQMITSTAALAFVNWNCMMQQARRWILSKQKEDEAKILLRDKVRFSVQHLPEWLRKLRGCRMKPEIEARYPTDSTILAVAENVADTAARGGTCTGVIIDEAARQEHFKDIVAAARPMARLIVALTTAEIGNQGARDFRSYAEIGTRVET
jgi:hypothetical protein